MADLLIFDKEHYMDSWTPVELANRIKDDPTIEEKYNRRYQKGDVIEVRPDGYWSGIKGRNFDKNCFCVVSIPDKELSEIKFLDEPLFKISTDPEAQPEILKKKKYNIDTNSIVFNNKIAMENFLNLKITIKDNQSEWLK